MSRIDVLTTVDAPVERVFDLARSVELHLDSTAQSGESAIRGKTSGLLDLGEQVTWRARHFGIWQELTSKVVAYDRPRHFRDSQVSGAFARFDHDHYFRDIGGKTEMRDIFDFDCPLSIFGKLADRLVVHRYLKRFLIERNEVIRGAAEGAAWEKYVRA